MHTSHQPALQRIVREGVAFWTDVTLGDAHGVVIAFSERIGGHSEAPFSSLNLAAHVGDDAGTVDRNRSTLLSVLGLSDTRERLTTAEQVHGTNIVRVHKELAGACAFAAKGVGPVPATDALFTSLPSVPLLMCFADCVPIVLVAPGPVVAVVHSGWRGTLGRIASLTLQETARAARCRADEVIAYVGPHIGSCHYAADERIMSQFVNAFGTFARAESGGLDLGSIVAVDLARSGVPTCRIVSLGACTAEQTDCFFSYRAEGGVTGRHGALACILP